MKKTLMILSLSALCVQLSAATKSKKDTEAPPAQDQSITANTEAQKEIIDQAKIYLKRGYHLDEALKSLNGIKPVDLLFTENIIPEIFKCLDAPTINKTDRLAMLDFLFKKTNLKSEEGQKIIKDLLSRVKDIRSPVLSEKMLVEFFKLKPKVPDDILNSIINLQNDILEDMTNPLTKRIFNHPDYLTTLKDLKKSNDPKSKRLLLKIYQNMSSKDMAQVIRTEILKTMAELTLSTVGSEAYFSKLETNDIFITLTTLLKNAKLAFLEPQNMSAEDIEEFKQLLLLTENILGNPDTDRNRNSAIEQVVGLLRSHVPNISKLAGECLVNTKVIEIEYRLSGLDLGPILIENANSRKTEFESVQKMLKEAEQTAQKNVENGESVDQEKLDFLKKAAAETRRLNHAALEILSHYGIILIRASTKEPQAQLVPTFEQLKKSFNEQTDFNAKKICLEAFSNLDIDLVKSRYFPTSALAVLDEMFEQCIAVLGIQVKNEDLDKLKIEITRVLSETTGMNFTSPKDWDEWKKGPLGQRFFKRLN
jgi:hypothetical protein